MTLLGYIFISPFQTLMLRRCDTNSVGQHPSMVQGGTGVTKASVYTIVSLSYQQQ